MSDDSDPTLMRPLRARGSSKGEAEKRRTRRSGAESGTGCVLATPVLLRSTACWRHQLEHAEWQALAAIFTLGEPTISQISRRVYRPVTNNRADEPAGGRGWVRELGERPSKFA